MVALVKHLSLFLVGKPPRAIWKKEGKGSKNPLTSTEWNLCVIFMFASGETLFTFK